MVVRWLTAGDGVGWLKGAAGVAVDKGGTVTEAGVSSGVVACCNGTTQIGALMEAGVGSFDGDDLAGESGVPKVIAGWSDPIDGVGTGSVGDVAIDVVCGW